MENLWNAACVVGVVFCLLVGYQILKMARKQKSEKRVFIGYKHTGEDPEELRKLLGLVVETFSSVGVIAYCTFFDEEYFKQKNMTAGDVMNHAFETIDEHDAFFVVQASPDKSEGMLMEVGYCRAKSKPIAVATHESITNTYLPEMGTHSFSWGTHSDLAEGIRNYAIELKKNNSCNLKKLENKSHEEGTDEKNSFSKSLGTRGSNAEY